MLAAQVAGLLATAAVLLAAAVDLRGTAIVLVVAAVIEGSAFVLFSIAEVGAVFSPRSSSSPSGPRLTEGLVWLWRIPYLRVTSLVTGFTNVLFQCVILLVLVVATRDNRPAWTVGLVLAAAGVGGLLASLVIPSLERRFPPRGLFLTCVWSWTALLAMIALSTHPVVLAIAWGGVGAVGTIVAVTLTVTRARAVPDNMLGRIVSAAAVLTDGAVPLGALVGGYLLAATTAETTARILAVAMLVAALLSTRFLRSAPTAVRPTGAEP
ncbi:MFS transporter [Actinoplanes sp. TRM 88003]|uniref:MFS transporter n=1 Tax=Paractinoplanes aksuensis TaxID=2939490 RepID=A0ABT1DK37_9ACTN|nr:MFS transporter [Actinoplanes aksuensis]MCO8271208.1 MFS transporter [Actinoplanes aksuensis]